MSNRNKPDWEDKFITLLSANPSVALAARGSGISRTTVYNYRKQSVEFAQRWRKAKAEALELLEAEAWQRARKQSDTLMIFLLKAHKPNKYQDRLRILHDFNSAEIKTLRQIKDLLDKYDQPASDVFNDLLNELVSQDAQHSQSDSEGS